MKHLKSVIIILCMVSLSMSLGSCSKKNTPGTVSGPQDNGGNDGTSGQGEWESSGNTESDLPSNPVPDNAKSANKSRPTSYGDIVVCVGEKRQYARLYWNYFVFDSHKTKANANLQKLNLIEGLSYITEYIIKSKFEVDQSLVDLTKAEVLKSIVKKIKRVAPRFAKNLSEKLNHFEANVWTKADSETVNPHPPLPLTENCASHWITNIKFDMSNSKEESFLLYELEKFNELTGVQQVALVLKEFFVADQNKLRIYENDEINKFVAFLLSTDLEKMIQQPGRSEYMSFQMLVYDLYNR